MLRPLLVVLLGASCGRVGFDALPRRDGSTAGSGDAIAGSGDARVGADATAAGINCGTTVCAPGTSGCCVNGALHDCVATQAACSGMFFACDDTPDCGSQVCCGPSGGGSICKATCSGNEDQLCLGSSDCPMGVMCCATGLGGRLACNFSGGACPA